METTKSNVAPRSASLPVSVCSNRTLEGGSERAKAAAAGLGLFVRQLVGMDRAAAKASFAAFLAGRPLTANQIEFLDMVVEHLTENGVMDAERLYESPYTDLNPLGVDGLFAQEGVDELLSVLDEVRRRAAA